MRAILLEVPQTEDHWAVWSLHNKLDHDAIRQAILTQKGINLPQYNLDPIPFDAPLDWLAWEQQSHSDVNNVLGTQGHDLEGVDFRDPRQLEAWVWLDYLEHRTWGDILGV